MKEIKLLRISHSTATGKSLPNEIGTQTRKENSARPSLLPFEVVVMAGGRGERLKPLTDSCPKPLLQVGMKPIVEYQIDRLQKIGIRNFTFCLNYLGEQVEAYFGDGEKRGLDIQYLFENSPLGTIGGVALKEEFRFTDILVINGDLLTTINFERFYAFFLEQDADIAVASIPYRVNLPYGILEMDNGNVVRSIKEKPNYTYYINTGMYFIKQEVLELIPRDTRFDAIDLIEKAIEAGLKVSTFPLLEYWIDIGQMDDYHKAQEDIKFLDL
ncbi:MAG: NTP transferase domain-containing protein [Bacteroidia bacterium]|nr:NTP transferase domain-containing protein [Bacteroidia bacterium]